MLPLNSTSDEVPLFVNVKQYNGILRRRQYRAKAELENKVLKNRKVHMNISVSRFPIETTGFFFF